MAACTCLAHFSQRVYLRGRLIDSWDHTATESTASNLIGDCHVSTVRGSPYINSHCSSYPPRGQQSNTSTYDNSYSHQEQEHANDAAVDELRSKVSSLRDVSIKIGEESRNSIGYMEEMNADYSKQFDSMRRMKNRLLTAANAHSWGWFHLLLFSMLVFFIFFLVYLFK